MKTQGMQWSRLVFAPVAAAALIGAVASCSSADSESGSAAPAVGDCIEVTDNADSAMVANSGDCGSAAAAYRISALDAECGVDTNTFDGTVDDAATQACLVPNYQVDTCYTDAGQRPALPVDCGAQEVSYRVAEVLEGETDPFACPTGDNPQETMQFRVVEEPATVFCMAAPAPA